MGPAPQVASSSMWTSTSPCEPFYLEACGFRPTLAGLLELQS